MQQWGRDGTVPGLDFLAVPEWTYLHWPGTLAHASHTNYWGHWMEQVGTPMGRTHSAGQMEWGHRQAGSSIWVWDRQVGPGPGSWGNGSSGPGPCAEPRSHSPHIPAMGTPCSLPPGIPGPHPPAILSGVNSCEGGLRLGQHPSSPPPSLNSRTHQNSLSGPAAQIIAYPYSIPFDTFSDCFLFLSSSAMKKYTFGCCPRYQIEKHSLLFFESSKILNSAPFSLHSSSNTLILLQGF